MRDALRALSAAIGVAEISDRAIYWYRNTPIPEVSTGPLSIWFRPTSSTPSSSTCCRSNPARRDDSHGDRAAAALLPPATLVTFLVTAMNVVDFSGGYNLRTDADASCEHMAARRPKYTHSARPALSDSATLTTIGGKS